MKRKIYKEKKEKLFYNFLNPKQKMIFKFVLPKIV